MIDAPGKYLTRDGKLATITAIERKGPFPAKGTLHLPKLMTVQSTWKLSGQYGLVNYPPNPLDIVSKYDQTDTDQQDLPISSTP